MKKCFVMLIIFLAFALNSYSQDNTTLRFVKVNGNKIEAALIFSVMEAANFESMRSKFEIDGSYSIEASYISEKKIGSFVLKSKSVANINDFEIFIMKAMVSQVLYKNKLINSTEISENYKPISTETINNKNFNSK